MPSLRWRRDVAPFVPIPRLAGVRLVMLGEERQFFERPRGGSSQKRLEDGYQKQAGERAQVHQRADFHHRVVRPQ